MIRTMTDSKLIAQGPLGTPDSIARTEILAEIEAVNQVLVEHQFCRRYIDARILKRYRHAIATLRNDVAALTE